MLRTVAAGPLPGKSLVVYEPAPGLVTDVFPCEDGPAQERSLFGAVLKTVEAGDLWIEDRHFCTREFLCEIDGREAFLVAREPKGLPFEILSPLRAWGRPPTGEIAQQRVRVTDAKGNPHVFRRLRIKLKQATRDGDKRLYILTNLPRQVSAKRVAELYRRRWTLEMGQPQYCHLGIFCWTRAASPISSNPLNAGDRWGSAQWNRLSVKPPLTVGLSY